MQNSNSTANSMFYSPAIKYNPVVQDRVANTIAYFGTGLSITGLVAALARNSRFAFMNPWALLISSIAGMIGCQLT